MDILFIFAALLAVVSSSPVPEDNTGTDETADQVLSILKVGLDESNLTYWFFSNENPIHGLAVNTETVSVLSGSSFSTTRDTIFLVHGWHNTNTSSFLTTVRPAVLNNLDVNLFVVDWSEIAAQSYIPARNSVPEVGRLLGDFITSLVSYYNLSLSQTTLVGHSLGGHVVGNAGAALNGKISVIVGLDPALPLFVASSTEDRLDASDAQFVQVIHTNGGFKGLLFPLGHSDYYPNGGMRQPGCGIDLNGSCAHARAFEYYAESLRGGRFVGVSCRSYREFTNGACSKGNTSFMGTYHIDKSASGSYYLDTNSESPYAKG